MHLFLNIFLTILTFLPAKDNENYSGYRRLLADVIESHDIASLIENKQFFFYTMGKVWIVGFQEEGSDMCRIITSFEQVNRERFDTLVPIDTRGVQRLFDYRLPDKLGYDPEYNPICCYYVLMDSNMNRIVEFDNHIAAYDYSKKKYVNPMYEISYLHNLWMGYWNRTLINFDREPAVRFETKWWSRLKSLIWDWKKKKRDCDYQRRIVELS